MVAFTVMTDRPDGEAVAALVSARGGVLERRQVELRQRPDPMILSVVLNPNTGIHVGS
jgi:hypothetical protein